MDMIKINQARIFLTIALILNSIAFVSCGYFESDEVRLEKTQLFFQQGDLASAEVLAKKILQSDNNNSKARFMLGKIQFAKYRLTDAIDSFKKAKYSGYIGDELLEYWAKALMYQGKYDLAHDIYQDAIFAEIVDKPFALQLKGDLFLLQNKYAEARSAYQQHFTKTNDAAANCLAMVKLLTESKNADEIIKRSQACEEQYKNNSEFDVNQNRYIRAINLLNKKEYSSALSALETISNAYTNRDDVHFRLQTSILMVKLYILTKQPKKAAEKADTALIYVVHPDLVYAKAMAAMQDRNYVEAERLHLEVLKLAPEYKPSLLEMTKLKYMQGNTEQAKYYAGKMDAVSEEVMLLDQLNIAEAAKSYRKGNFDDVIESLSITSNKDVKSKILLVLAYAKKKDSKNVWLTYNDVAKLIGDKQQKEFLKARLHVELGEVSAAEAIYKTYLQANDVRAMLAMAGLYVKTKQYQHAEDMLRKALASDRNNKNIVFLLIDFYTITNDPNKLFTLLQSKVTETNDRDYEILLANAYHQYGEYESAINISNKLLVEDKSNIDAYAIAASSYTKLKKYSEAEKIYKELKTLHPDNIQAYFLLAKLNYLQEKYAEARAELESALAIQPDYLPAINAMIDVYLAQKDNKAALNYANQAIPKIADKKLSALLLAQTYYKTGNDKKALEYYLQVHDADKSDIKIAFEIYKLTAAVDGLDAAKSFFDAWLNDMAKPEYYLAAAGYTLDISHHDLAQKYYEHYLEKGEPNPIAYNNLSWLYSETGKLDKALDYAQKALALVPDSPEIQDSVGWILVKSGKYNDAEPYLLQAQKKLNKHPSVNFHLATLYYHLNQNDKAGHYLGLTDGMQFPEIQEAEKLRTKLQ